MQLQTRGEFGGLGHRSHPWKTALIQGGLPDRTTTPGLEGRPFSLQTDIITNLDDEAVQGLTLNQAVGRCAARSTPRSG